MTRLSWFAGRDPLEERGQGAVELLRLLEIPEVRRARDDLQMAVGIPASRSRERGMLADTVMFATNVIRRVVAALPALGDGGNGARRDGHQRE